MMHVPYTMNHNRAMPPERGTDQSAGIDLYAAETILDTHHSLWFDTGIAVAIPEGYVGLVFPRSSISKLDLMMANGVGVIDSDYRGSIQVRFNKRHPYDYSYGVGDKIAQLLIMPAPIIPFVEVAELDATERGAGGFGSTGQ